MNSPRPGTPGPVIRDGTPDPACRSSPRRLRWRLRFGSALSGRGGTCRHVSCSFHMPLGILFIFRSSYWCAIGLWTCLGLGGLHSRIPLEIPVQRTLYSAAFAFSPTGPSPSLAASSKGIRLSAWRHYLPTSPFRFRTDSGRPLPLSLAVTHGIAFAFSSTGYHDASPRRVRLPGPFPTEVLLASEPKLLGLQR